MKKKIIIISVAVAVVVIGITAALIIFLLQGEKGVNILEQPNDYVGEFYIPSSKKVEEGSALSVLTNINEELFKINSAAKTMSDDPSVLESYRIDCYGVNIELFKYTDDSQRLAEVRESGKFIVRSADGTVLKEFNAVANGHYVIMFLGSTDATGEDLSEQNQKVIDQFKSLTLE